MIVFLLTFCEKNPRSYHALSNGLIWRSEPPATELSLNAVTAHEIFRILRSNLRKHTRFTHIAKTAVLFGRLRKIGGFAALVRAAKLGGSGGIRTHERVTPLPHFECGPL